MLADVGPRHRVPRHRRRAQSRVPSARHLVEVSPRACCARQLAGGLGVVRRLLACRSIQAASATPSWSHRHLDHARGLEPMLLTTTLPRAFAPSVGAFPRARRAPTRWPPELPAAIRAASLAGTWRSVGCLPPKASLQATCYAGSRRHPARAVAPDASVGLTLTGAVVINPPAAAPAAGWAWSMSAVRASPTAATTRPCDTLAESRRAAWITFIHRGGRTDARATPSSTRVGHSTAGDAGHAWPRRPAPARSRSPHLRPPSGSRLPTCFAEARASRAGRRGVPQRGRDGCGAPEAPPTGESLTRAAVAFQAKRPPSSATSGRRAPESVQGIERLQRSRGSPAIHTPRTNGVGGCPPNDCCRSTPGSLSVDDPAMSTSVRLERSPAGSQLAAPRR